MTKESLLGTNSFAVCKSQKIQTSKARSWSEDNTNNSYRGQEKLMKTNDSFHSNG